MTGDEDLLGRLAAALDDPGHRQPSASGVAALRRAVAHTFGTADPAVPRDEPVMHGFPQAGPGSDPASALDADDETAWDDPASPEAMPAPPLDEQPDRDEQTSPHDPAMALARQVDAATASATGLELPVDRDEVEPAVDERPEPQQPAWYLERPPPPLLKLDTPRPRRRRRTLRRVPALAAAALLVAGVAAGGYALGSARQEPEAPPAGELEYAGPLHDAAGDPVAQVEVRKVGIGRVIALQTDALPILPAGQFYELWFVARADSPTVPQRISAGTFHPAPDGSTKVQLAAAVDPQSFPVLSVTAEPADGDPSRSGTEILRAEIP